MPKLSEAQRRMLNRSAHERGLSPMSIYRAEHKAVAILRERGLIEWREPDYPITPGHFITPAGRRALEREG